MSENIALPVVSKKSTPKLLFFGIAVLLVLLVYGAGIIAFPITIQAYHHDKNCGPVLALNRVYTGLYPGFMEDQALPDVVGQCEAYTLARANTEQGHWQEAYDACQAYSTQYPDGLYAREVHEDSANALLNIARDETEHKKYEEALVDLSLIVSGYSDTNVSAEAWTLIPSTYLQWGAGLRTSEDFETSERVFNDLRAWSQNNQKPDIERESQGELARTYIDWGQALLTQKEFEAGLSRFDLAISTAPDLVESVAEARSGQRKTYIEWGNDLLAQGNYPLAVEKFEQAVSRTDGDNADGASDSLANGHIQWAAELGAGEDFFGALEHLEIAQQAARTEDMTLAIETALQETYVAFSKSTGRQTKQVVRDTLVSVCEENDAPEFPIFGLEKDSVRVGLSGVETQWPEELTARTPGEMRYVACVQVERRVLDVEGNYARVKTPSGVYVIPLNRVSRIQVFWTITVRESATGKILGTETFAGGPPPPLPRGRVIGDSDLEGAPPSLEAVTKWLLSVIK